jgi:hypothetical protein
MRARAVGELLRPHKFGRAGVGELLRPHKFERAGRRLIFGPHKLGRLSKRAHFKVRALFSKQTFRTSYTTP